MIPGSRAPVRKVVDLIQAGSAIRAKTIYTLVILSAMLDLRGTYVLISPIKSLDAAKNIGVARRVARCTYKENRRASATGALPILVFTSDLVSHGVLFLT